MQSMHTGDALIPKGFGIIWDDCRDAGPLCDSVQLYVNQNSMQATEGNAALHSVLCKGTVQPERA